MQLSLDYSEIKILFLFQETVKPSKETLSYMYCSGGREGEGDNHKS